MSIQSFFANLILRWQFKKGGKGPINVQFARAKVNKLAERYPPPPKDITHTPVPAQVAKGLCPAEWLSVARPERTVVYFHGGGYFFCGLTTHRPVAAYLARTANAKVLSVDYRMAPENRFPAAVDDAVAWWKELLAQGVNPSEVVFAGDSAGGGLTLACLLAARQQGLPLPAGALLFSPWTDLTCSGETMRTMAEVDVMFNPESLPEAATFYVDTKDLKNPLASPLYGDMTGMPEMLIFASNHEILLSDSIRLHDKLKQQGVRSELIRRDKLPHVWPTMLMLPEARKDLKVSGDFITRVTRAALAKAA
jgi:epsilon-lactone hydrolase